MKPHGISFVSIFAIFAAGVASASEAGTSATAGRNGASGTATYEGRIGFADSNARSGSINVANGLAVGFDEQGLSVSLSSAVAPRFGPATAATASLNIGLDGEVSRSVGLSVGDRNAAAGSAAAPGAAVAEASGGPRGRSHVSAETTRSHAPAIRGPYSRHGHATRGVVLTKGDDRVIRSHRAPVRVERETRHVRQVTKTTRVIRLGR